MKFRVVIKLGQKIVAQAEGVKDTPAQSLTTADLEGVVKAEHLLEKLTGYRVHVEQVR